jgi:hypothetical protein
MLSEKNNLTVTAVRISSLVKDDWYKLSNRFEVVVVEQTMLLTNVTEESVHIKYLQDTLKGLSA